MDNNTGEKDPWANLGNMAGNKSKEEISEEGLAREAEWNTVMSDVPEFGNNPTDAERDKSIAEASAIIKYGVNAASREVGVESVMQTINNFVPEGDNDPIKQLYLELGIDTQKNYKEFREEARATKARENEFLSNNVNAPASMKRSKEDALQAIKEVKDLVSEVKSSPAYADLREEALHCNKGVFEYAVSKYGVRDLTVLFDALSEEKQKYNKAQAEDVENADTTEAITSIENPQDISDIDPASL